jgi:cytolysin-activating lysine-acyltransferase
MDATQLPAEAPGAEFLKSLNKNQIGAAFSKLVAASVGDIVTVFSRSPAQKHLFLADIEWAIMPAVVRGQFYLAEAENQATGFRTPIAVATWAFVSEGVDQRLQAELAQHIRLRPDEWKSGEIGWIIDLVGDPRGIEIAAEWLKGGPFKDRDARLVSVDAMGVASLTSLSGLPFARRPQEEAR